MIFTPTRLEDAYVVDVELKATSAASSARTFCEREFAEHGLPMRSRPEQHDLQPAP